MGAPYQPLIVCNIADVSSGLASLETRNLSFYNWSSLDAQLSVILNMESEILRWKATYYPADPTLQSDADYVYALCGRFIGKALQKLGADSGGIVINPTTNQPIQLIVYREDFTLGTSRTPNYSLAAGDTSYTIPLSGFLVNSLEMYPGGTLLIEDDPTVFSCSVIYAADYAIIQFNQPVRNGQRFTVWGLRSTTGTAGGGGGTSGPTIPLPLVKGAYITNDGTRVLWDSPELKYTSADFTTGDGVTVIDTRLAIHDYDLYYESPQSVLLVPDVDYSVTASGGFVILMEGFDARTNDYTLTAKMKTASTS